MKCSHCKKVTPKNHLIAYSKKVNLKGELVSYFMCRECNRIRAKKYRHTKQGHIRFRKTLKKSTLKFFSKQLARQKLYRALKNNLIKRKKCWCGETKVFGHHNDYSKSLEVIWLCRTHHANLHQKLKYETKI